MLGGGGGNVTFHGIWLSRVGSFIIEISMYFGATSEVACSDGHGNRVFYIGGSAGRAPWDTRL